MLVVLALVPLMALAGFFDAASGLLMVSPFLALIGLLLLGLYPGERLIDELVRTFAGERATSTPPLVRLGLRFAVPSRLLLVGTPGSRAPPPFA